MQVAAGSSLIMAIFLTWLRPSFETMFTNNIAWTVLEGIIWFGVFTLIFRFHPAHGAALGLLSMLIIPAAATLGVDSLTKPSPPAAAPQPFKPTKPVRAAIGQTPPAKTEAAPKK